MNVFRRTSQRFLSLRHCTLVALSAFACLVAQAADEPELRYAARIESLAGITAEIGKYPHPNSPFFQSPCVLAELRRILGRDFQPYRRHLMLAGAGTFEKDGDFVCGDISQLHVGGYDSLLYVDPKKERMYLFWLKSSVTEGRYEVYGDRPVPAAILASVARRMNTSWGHVASFKSDGERLIIEPKYRTAAPE